MRIKIHHRRKSDALCLCLYLLMTLGFSRFIHSTEKPAAKVGLAVVELTLVDGKAGSFATFHSHNQKVVQNGNGLFMTHLRTRNEAYTAQQWRLSRSTDGGKTFATVYESTDATNPPVLETDANNIIYLIRPDFLDGNAYLYRFYPEDDYSEPEITTIPGGSAGKYCMAYDSERLRLYYSAWGLTFYSIGLDGTIIQKLNQFKSGKNASAQYPIFCLGQDGTLHMAYTTVKHGEYMYWSDHYLKSPDGGESWTKMDGTPITGFPVVVDDGGPTDMISYEEEFESHTWLSNMLAKDGNVHFIYRAQAPANSQHYMRFDENTGEREIDIQPVFRGNDISIGGLGAFFAADRTVENSPLYALSWSSGRIGCLASDDNGETWYDYAASSATFGGYSIGGCRAVTKDGYIIGSFTDTAPDPQKVYFFKIKAGLTQAKVKSSEYDNGVLSISFAKVHGNPEHVRFSTDNIVWSPWHVFSENIIVDMDVSPVYFQLKSSIGVESSIMYASQESPEKWESITTANGLPDNETFSVIKDSMGSLWFGTRSGGAAHYDHFDWTAYSTEHGLVNDYVYSIFEDSNGDIWFGTYGGGISKFDRTTWTTYTSADGLAKDQVVSIGQDSNGAMWFGTRNGGLSKFDGTNWTTYTTDDGLAGRWVRSIERAPDGTMWFGTNLGGLSLYDGSDFTSITTEQGLLSNRIYAIAIDSDGTAWISTYGNGVAHYDGSSWTTYSTVDGLASNYVNAIAIDHNGAVWFGTEGYGITRFDGEDWITFTYYDGLPDNTVKSIAVDNKGDVWVGTRVGVGRFYIDIPSLVEKKDAAPDRVSIEGNYPNPFNPETTINFSVPAETGIELGIYNITGQKIRSLYPDKAPVGRQSVTWDGKDTSGQDVSSGIYFAVIEAGDAVTAHRMMLLR